MTIADTRLPLARSRQAVLGGVCAGVARHLGWGVRRTRLLAIVLALFGGAGLLLYWWLWALAPLEKQDPDAAAGVARSAPVAVLLEIAAGVSILTMLAAGSTSTASLAIVAVALVSALAWSLGFDRADPSRSARYLTGTRVVAVVVLIGTGLVTLLRPVWAIDAVVAFAMIFVGIGFFAAPRVVTLWSDLLAERATRVRQEQRAEIAAHLHDSVLQTLALIQNRAGASSEVARIARAQERELRDWLFAGDDPVAVDLATDLRELAAAIELEYPVRIEFVTAGDSEGHSSNALVAAAREAMINAARHAGGDVSVYLESSPSATDVFVRDRGPGVDLASLPQDRLGIRESIIGRMTRAGGSATVRPGASGLGTEVHLHLEAQHA